MNDYHLISEYEQKNKNLQSKRKELEDRVCQMELENNIMREEKQALNDDIFKIQDDYDSCKDGMAIAIMEKNNLIEENDDLMKVVSYQGKNTRQLEEEKEALQRNFDEKMMEIEKINKLYANGIEEKKQLQEELLKLKSELEDANNIIGEKETAVSNVINEKQSLTDTIANLQLELNTYKSELSKTNVEIDDLKEANQTFLKDKIENKEEKEALQQNLEAKKLEIDRIQKFYSKELEEKKSLYQKSLKMKHDFEDADNLIVQVKNKLKWNVNLVLVKIKDVLK